MRDGERVRVCDVRGGRQHVGAPGSREWDSFSVIDVGGRVERLSLFVLGSWGYQD